MNEEGRRRLWMKMRMKFSCDKKEVKEEERTERLKSLRERKVAGRGEVDQKDEGQEGKEKRGGRCDCFYIKRSEQQIGP